MDVSSTVNVDVNVEKAMFLFPFEQGVENKRLGKQCVRKHFVISRHSITHSGKQTSLRRSSGFGNFF